MYNQSQIYMKGKYEEYLTVTCIKDIGMCYTYVFVLIRLCFHNNNINQINLHSIFGL